MTRTAFLAPLAIVTLTLAAVTHAVAQDIPTIPTSAARFASIATPQATATVATWITKQAATATIAPGDAVALDLSLRKSIGDRFAGQTLGDAGADALVLLVMVETMKQLREQIGSLLEQMRLVRAERDKLRAFLQQLRAAVDSAKGLDDQRKCPYPICGSLRTGLTTLATSQTAAGIASPVVPRDGATVGDLRAAAEDVAKKLDSIEELGKNQQLRLQQLMERIERLQAQISALMKNVSDAQAVVIGNLK